jgi:hypothetical protein
VKSAWSLDLRGSSGFGAAGISGFNRQFWPSSRRPGRRPGCGRWCSPAGAARRGQNRRGDPKRSSTTIGWSWAGSLSRFLSTSRTGILTEPAMKPSFSLQRLRAHPAGRALFRPVLRSAWQRQPSRSLYRPAYRRPVQSTAPARRAPVQAWVGDSRGVGGQCRSGWGSRVAVATVWQPQLGAAGAQAEKHEAQQNQQNK